MAHARLLSTQTGHPADARRTFQQIQTIAPDNALAYAGLARAEILSGNLEAAATHLAQAKERSPRQPEVLLVEAQLLWKQGDKQAAVQLLRQITADPNLSRLVKDELRQLLKELGQPLPTATD
ncbi:MAG: tetratricopeptide repeat protein [Anaerolineae bacterium]